MYYQRLPYPVAPTARAPIGEASTARGSRVAPQPAPKPCYAGVSSDRTNLSPFTKDYRGLALPCEFRVFAARKGAAM